jgi:predicted O-linked N-acetylglucosamine transferase (SPINDLY family)
MAGLEELLAENIDHYVALASQLGRDPALRGRISEKISRAKHRLYRDVECIRGLEVFLKEAVASY